MTVTLESLKKSVGKKSAKSEIFAWLADLERASGDLDGALQRVNGGLTLYPNDVAAMIVRAKILFQQEKFEECVQQCETILVKDTFNLAGQKIMGDAYDRLGKIPERNVCYRRYHDMDPLNTFWKEEYDVVEAAVAAAVAADLAMPDGDFSMPEEDSGLFINTLDEQGSGSVGEDGSSMEGAFEKAFGDTFGSEESSASEDDGGLFEKSASSIGLSLDDDSQAGETASPFSKGFDDDQDEESLSMSAPLGGFDNSISDSLGVSVQDESSEDDPFAALAAMLPNSDAAEDSMMDDLSASLDATMANISAEDSADKPVEEFPADDNISGNDVTSAMASFFGLDDDLEAEDTSAAGSNAIEETPVDENASANASMVFGSVADDKPMSVDNAFNSIFGEDELPEELPQAQAAPVAESQELPAEEPLNTAPAEDKPMSVDNAFDSIFGEDELPEEKSLELPAEESLELPVEEDVKLDGEWNPSPVATEPVAEESVVEEKLNAPASEESFSVSSAFDSIFGGEEDLPEEKPQAVTEESLELSVEDGLELPAEEDVKLDGEWNPSPVASESIAEESVVEEKLNAPASEDSLSVSSAFDSIFGGDEDLPEEKPQAVTEESLELPAEEGLDLPAEDVAMVEEVESPSAPAITSAMDFVLDDEPAAPAAEPAPEAASAAESSFTVDSAFSSIFGDDDDLPEEKPVEANVEDAPATETISLAEQVDQAEAELELPSIQKDGASDLAQEMGGAFASMFGDQDDLDLPNLDESMNKVMPAAEDDQQATGAAFEEASANKLESDLDKSFSNLFGSDDDLSISTENTVETAQEIPAMQNMDSLESEVSGAFKGLFEMDDDSLNMDQDKPSNSGVDFLMSGDSDDEVSAGLINNPDAPLNRGAQELDESLNTKTLAEIYFDQGLYGKALDIYKDLAQKEPENEEIASRMAEVEKLFREKFGGNG